MKFIKILVMIFCCITLCTCLVFILTIVGAIGYGVIFSPAKTTTTSLVQVDSVNVDTLNSREFYIKDLINGTGGSVVGKYGYIEMTLEELKSVTQEDFKLFVSTNVEGSGLNYVSIIFGDGTGICFTGSTEQIFVYCYMDENGLNTQEIDTYILSDGSYKKL